MFNVFKKVSFLTILFLLDVCLCNTVNICLIIHNPSIIYKYFPHFYQNCTRIKKKIHLIVVLQIKKKKKLVTFLY